MDKQQEDMWVQTGAQLAAARAMLKALTAINDRAIGVAGHNNAMREIAKWSAHAIKLAEEAGITTGEK
jgi:hypothetical protein